MRFLSPKGTRIHSLSVAVTILKIFHHVFVLISLRICTPPHAALRGGVPAVRLPLDEQPPDEGAAATVHDQTVGHVSGAITQQAHSYPAFLP